MKFVAGIIIVAANANTLNPGKRLIKRFQKAKNNFEPNPKSTQNRPISPYKTDPRTTQSTENRPKPIPIFNSHIL